MGAGGKWLRTVIKCSGQNLSEAAGSAELTVVTSAVQSLGKPPAPGNGHLGQEREGAAKFLPSEKGKSPVTFVTRGWGRATSPCCPTCHHAELCVTAQGSSPGASVR